MDCATRRPGPATDGPGTHECKQEIREPHHYFDDVVIATPSLDDHIERLNEVFNCMKQMGLSENPQSVKFSEIP